MRAPWRPDWQTDDEDEHARIYHPDPVDPPDIEATVTDPPDVLVDADGNPIPGRIPFGFQPPKEQP